MNHLGKIAFKWVYWNMLLPGHLPKVPLLPSHMNFLGKDLSTAPRMRHAGTLSRAVELMDRNKIKRLVVTDAERKSLGIVSRGDLMKPFAMK